MTPYYEQDGVTIYHGDCRDIAPRIGGASLLLSDPPYGIGYTSNHNTRKKAGGWAKWVRDDNFESIEGDFEPFDPSPWLTYPLVMLFGGNYYSSRLPESKCWIVWDKREDVAPDQTADCEFVWTNLNRPARIVRHLWRGLQRRGEENVSKAPKLHPHQKPVRVMDFLIDYSGLTDGCVLDPYAGSGTTLLAAKRRGLRAIGIEINERYCETAAKRLAQGVLPMEFSA